MNGKLRDESTDMLFQGILSLDSLDECYAFFEDICTIAEIKSLAQRLQVAVMLRGGKTYTEICDLTGVSTATISRVNRSLEYGADGYKIVLDKLGIEEIHSDRHNPERHNYDKTGKESNK